MVAPDRALGLTLLLFSAALLVYYTLWLIISPLIDEGHSSIHSLFPPREIGIVIPTLLQVAVVTFATAFIGCLHVYA